MSDNFLSLEFGVGGWKKWKGDKSYFKYDVFTVTGDSLLLQGILPTQATGVAHNYY